MYFYAFPFFTMANNNCMFVKFIIFLRVEDQKSKRKPGSVHNQALLFNKLLFNKLRTERCADLLQPKEMLLRKKDNHTIAITLA